MHPDWAEHVRRAWRVQHVLILRTAIVWMAVAALVWLSYEFWRLIWQTGYWGAIDLRMLQRVVARWFSGQPVYGESTGVMYPPASFVIVWPLLGWLAFEPARWLWAGTTIVALAWLCVLVLHTSGATTRLERVLIVVLPLSMYATGAAIGNGQSIVHILPALIAGMAWLQREKPSGRAELFAAGCILASLVKPTVSAPFFWIVLFATRRLRPACIIALGYAALTVWALSFQRISPRDIFTDWLRGSLPIAAELGTANLSLALAALGLKAWILPGALVLLGVLGIWIWHYRDRDLWVLMGVTAIVARLWIYHWWFDDLLLLLPMMTLFRIAKRGATSNNSDVMAGILFALLLLFSLAPGGLYLFPAPFNAIYVAVQVTIWIAVLIFLSMHARGETENTI